MSKTTMVTSRYINEMKETNLLKTFFANSEYKKLLTINERNYYTNITKYDDNATQSKLNDAFEMIMSKPVSWSRVGIIRFVAELAHGVKAALYIGGSEHNSEISLSLESASIVKEIESPWLNNWTISPESVEKLQEKSSNCAAKNKF
ncbi:MAG: hypothetical protein ACK4PR_01380 [Gammaproteobacteria bacterium]